MGSIAERDIPQIMKLLREVVGAESCKSLARMGGLTNHSYHVILDDDREYVIRIPGEGTEEMIVREDERKSTELACRLGIDARMLYFGPDGSKVTEYVKHAVTLSAAAFHDEDRVRKAAAIFRTIHSCGADTGVPFEVFQMAATYEKIIRDQKVPMFGDYEEQKAKVMTIKAQVDAVIPPRLVPCHNDPLCENWVEGDGKRLYLIDWEYAGMNDGMWDLADLSIEAGFDEVWDELLLRSYLEREPSVDHRRHFLASKLYVDFLWTLWAKTRVPFDGQSMEDWACERYARMKNNITAYEAL